MCMSLGYIERLVGLDQVFDIHIHLVDLTDWHNGRA